MKINTRKMRVSLLALAVQGALVAMCGMTAYADDEEVAALKRPDNFVEIGATNTTQDSTKLGEYTGFNKSGVNGVANFSLSGGDGYGDGGGTNRWSIKGSDLGTTSRALGASVGDQGQWSIGIGYDELRHNLWDTYKTPYVGSMGGNKFTLPASLLTVGGVPIISTVAAGLTPVGTDGAAAITAINAASNQVDVGTTRKNTSLTVGRIINDKWNVKFEFNHLDQSGAKLMSFPSMGTGGANIPKGEAIAILPNPTNYKTDTFNLALNWVGDKGHISTSYFGSFFRDGYDRVTFQTFAIGNAGSNTPASTQLQFMSTNPSNDFHQLNLNGGYAFSSKTKLTGGISYGRNTQNDSYVVDSYSMVVPAPQASLEGLVNTTHADLKLTNQNSKDLLLSVGIKYDERKDKTASKFYNFHSADGGNDGKFANTPYSNKKTQLELAGDYRISSDQHMRIAYNHEDVKRWCEQYAVSVGILPGASGYYPAGTNCVVAIASKDEKLSATYKLKARENVDMNFGYSISSRKTDSDPNAITARKGTAGNINLSAATLIWGLNAADFRGFYPVFSASRKEQMLKAGVNLQASERLSLALGAKYIDDKYDSLYGVKTGNSWSVNLDATYSYSESGSVSAYLTQQHKQRDMTDLYRSPTSAPGAASSTTLPIPAGATWSDQQKDDDTTIGIAAKQSGLMGAKLDLEGDLTYTSGKTNYVTQFNYAAQTVPGLSGLPIYTCASPQFLTCGSLPEINNHVIQLNLGGKYKLDKSSKIALGYQLQRMRSVDFYYNGLQAGYTPSALMPTGQQAPNYTVSVIAASYVRSF